MKDALLVNPHSAKEISDKLRRALTMPLTERIRRRETLMHDVDQHDVMRWLKRFTDAMEQVTAPVPAG